MFFILIVIKYFYNLFNTKNVNLKFYLTSDKKK